MTLILTESFVVLHLTVHTLINQPLGLAKNPTMENALRCWSVIVSLICQTSYFGRSLFKELNTNISFLPYLALLM